MLPIGEDYEGRSSTPVLTVSLAVVVFGVALATASPDRPELSADIGRTYGLVPERFWSDPLAQAWTLVSYAFLHGGPAHLATNLLFLWVFGKGIEREMGWGLLPLYLFSAVAAGLTSVWIRAGSDVPTVGASGAISGLLGAYLILLPNANIRAIIMIPWLFVVAVLRGDKPVWDVPAWTAIITWFLLQVGLALAPSGAASGVDYAAHIGGFLAGYLVIRALRAVFGLWPDEPTYERILDRPAHRGRRLPNSYVRAARRISAGADIRRDDLERVSRGSGYVDPDVVPGYDASTLIGKRLRETRYRYEPIRWHDVETGDQPVRGEAGAPRPA